MFKFNEWICVTILFRSALCDSLEKIKCDFENGLCGWKQSNDYQNSYWTRVKDGDNFLLHLGKNSTSSVEIRNIYINERQCFTFKYYMSHDNAGLLSVIMDENGQRSELDSFTQSYESGKSWTEAVVEMEARTKTMVTIILRGQTLDYSEIKMDNISITSGSCLDCSTEKDNCYWDGNSHWNLIRKWLYSASPKNESTLTSKSYVYPGKKCFSFQYNFCGMSKACLQLKFNNIVQFPEMKSKGSNVWIPVDLSIDLPSKSKIQILTVLVNYSNCKLGIGHISLKQGNCPETSTKIQTEQIGCHIASITTAYKSITTDVSTSITTIDASGNTPSTVTAALESEASTTVRSLNPTRQDTTNTSCILATPSNNSIVTSTTQVVILCVFLVVAALLVAIFSYRRISRPMKTKSPVTEQQYINIEEIND